MPWVFTNSNRPTSGSSASIRVPLTASRVRVATLVIFANVLGLILFFHGRIDTLLSAVVDPLHPDRTAMEQAFAGFSIYALSLIGVALLSLLWIARSFARSLRKRPRSVPWRASTIAAIAIALTAGVVLVFIEVLVFQDYGVHFYEFDVLGILGDAALRRDLGIQPAEVARVTLAAAGLFIAELLLCIAAFRLATWKQGALPRACGAALLLGVPGGFMMFRSGEQRIDVDRAEFEGALPLGKQLLFRATSRPFVPAMVRRGRGGYPAIGAGEAPIIRAKKNIVFFVADGLRGDMVRPQLTPNLIAFGARSDVIQSGRHISTGHVSESGMFGLLYAVQGHAFHAFMAERIASYPIQLLRRNGYRTLLIASSRLSPYPTDQLIRQFDEVIYPAHDDAAVKTLADFVADRRIDGHPYVAVAFFYTPHYPFTSAKPHLRKFPDVGPRARSNYMNDVLQADDYFRQTFELVRPDFERGTTLVAATADHGEEIRDHGTFGHAPATFWNEKIVVPFFLGLPGAALEEKARRPILSSHVDVWPTILDHLEVEPSIEPSMYSDGRSLLGDTTRRSPIVVTGRFFPYADRPSALVDANAKYWFRVSETGADNRLCIVVTRQTDLEDRPLVSGKAGEPRLVAAFEEYQAAFWRFLQPLGQAQRRNLRVC
jgi:Sulfatase